jgi:pimeloyl-ACP methyl ester carboxylesterase
MPIAIVNGRKFYYEQQGIGPDLVLIMGHGLTGKFWEDQVPVYSKHFRCLTFDNRGVGQTDVTPRGFTIEDMAGDTFGLLDALDIRRAHVSGISMGGSIAIAMALKAPERLSSLSLHSTMGRQYPHIKLRYDILIRVTELGDPDLWANATAFTAFAMAYVNDHPDVMKREIARRREQRRNMSAQEVEGIIGQYVAFSTYDPFDRLRSIQLPTQITVGSEDNVTPPRYSEDLQAQIPQSELVIFPGAPHRTLTFARDEFNRVTSEFLRADRDSSQTLRAQ